MTEQEFENLWEENKEKIRLNSDEYQSIKKSYYSWGLIDYTLLIGGFIGCEALLQQVVKSIILQYILALLGMLSIWLGWRYFKSRLANGKTLEEVDQELKERYKRTLRL